MVQKPTGSAEILNFEFSHLVPRPLTPPLAVPVLVLPFPHSSDPLDLTPTKMVSASTQSNGTTSAVAHAAALPEGHFLFTSESVGEGHPGL